MKKSDKKKIDKARNEFYMAVQEFMECTEPLSQVNVTVDDLNQMTRLLRKLARTERRICEQYIERQRKDYRIEHDGEDPLW